MKKEDGGKKQVKPPNWKLKPNPDVPEWIVDPLFETNEEVPFVSSVVHSKLLIR